MTAAPRRKPDQLELGQLCDDADGHSRATLLEPCVVSTHPKFGMPWCEPHRKIMSCAVHCAARWRECGAGVWG